MRQESSPLPVSRVETKANAVAVDDGTLAAMSESPIDRVLEQLATSEEGLTAEEAAARLQRYGLNRPPRPARSYWLVELAKQFMHLFAALLWTAAMLAWFVDMSELAMAVVAVILINGTFSYWQQFRAEQAVAALESLLPRQVSVRRNGREETISAEAVALGEILLLTEGSAVPADARLIQAERLRIDVSSLTGESRPVSRMTGTCTAQGKAAAEISNIVLAGSFVSSGRAEAVVFRTGIHTEFGRLAALTHLQPNRESPLQREMKRITRLITLLAVGMGLLFFGLGWGLGRLTLVEGFLFALGIIVANVPEGLLPTISLALAIGVRRMAGRHAIVKRLEGVETLGAITVIITDKTGTLTHNQMTVRGLWCAGRTYDVSGDGYEPAGQIVCDGSASPRGPDVVTLLRTAALCSDASLIPPVANDKHWTARGDPTEAALLVAAAKADVTETMLRQHPRVVELPFDSVRKRMTTIQQSSDELLACMKGAPNEVAPRCTSFVGLEGNNDACRDAVEEQVRMFADRGWRVLAIASRKISDAHRDEATIRPEMVERDLTFLGLIAMEDPPRAEVPAAVVNCRSAGIRIIMATGDDGRTAAAIAREIGLLEHEPRIISGSQLDEISDHALGMLLGHRDVLFARVNPSQKLRLVEALQQRGEVVAVTGDGVNDAPALKRADIGVAMGASGTDVARAAADMILLDDNFATIVAAIEEGRAVYENVRKFVTYIFASNVPEIVPFIAFVLFRIPLPLTVMQILAVDLGTDLLPALALGVESPETDTMHTPPRARTQPLLDRKTLLRAYGWLGAIEATLCLCGFFFVYLHSGWRIGNPMETAGPLYTMATTMSLAGIVACQLGNGLACRSERKSIFTLGLLSNRPLIAAMFLEVLILLVLVYIGPLAKVFGLAPLQPAHWGVLFWFGPVLLFAEEVRKWHLRRQN